MLLEWKIWRNQLTRLFLTIGPNLVNWGKKHFRYSLTHQMVFIGDKTLPLKCAPPNTILHTDTIPMTK